MPRKTTKPKVKKDNVVYVIQSIDWEYNDEYYYTTEDEAGHPYKAYKTEEAAKAALIELEVKSFKETFVKNDPPPNNQGYFWRGTALNEYVSDGLDSITSMEEFEFKTVLNGIGLLPEGDDPTAVMIPKNFPNDKVRVLVEACDKLRFHKIIEVEIE